MFYTKRETIKKYALLNTYGSNEFITHGPNCPYDKMDSWQKENEAKIADTPEPLIELAKNLTKEELQTRIVVQIVAVIEPVMAEPTVKEIV